MGSEWAGDDKKPRRDMEIAQSFTGDWSMRKKLHKCLNMKIIPRDVSIWCGRSHGFEVRKSGHCISFHPTITLSYIRCDPFDIIKILFERHPTPAQ